METCWRTLCLLLLLSACTDQLQVLNRDTATGKSDAGSCMCDAPELCAVDHCVNGAGITRLGVGYRHVCRIADGSLACWGENRASQLGVGDNMPRDTPTQVGDDHSWLELSAAEEHTCAIASPGRLYCWGNNLSGQLGTGDTATHNKPDRVGTYDDFERVFCGGDSSCALRARGALYCWGASGRLLGGSGDVLTPEIIDEPIEVLPGTHFKQVSLGAAHVCAVRDDGALLCWGQNNDGQLGLGMVSDMARQPTVLPRSNWTQVAAGQHHTCAIRSEGQLYCWGRGDSLELGVGMRRALQPTRVGQDSDWQSVAVGGSHTCAIKRNRQLYCWGRNSEGQLGATASDPVGTPMVVDSGSRYRTIALGAQDTCALDTGQTLYCWGTNDEGQLGLGDRMARYSPTLIE
jgi:alpha-tubulin suppressor-like RCC1 family protein